MLQWATPREADALRSILEHGTIELASAAIGLKPKSLSAHLSRLHRKAARAGWSPSHDLTHTVPDGYHVKGVSTYYDKEGRPRGQWVKSQKDAEHKLAQLIDAIADVAEPFRGKSEAPIEHDGEALDHLLTVYPMGDPHLGMLATAAETGENFDLKIAEADLVDAVDKLVNLAPASREALIVEVGDFFHTDNFDNRTTRSHHSLDVDSRWSKILSIGIRVMRRCIDRALEKHERVTVICEIGNHDDHTSIMLSHCLDLYYENNPRVMIDKSPQSFHWYRFGECLLGVTHGQKTKPQNLPGIMAVDRKEDWGQTTFRHFYTGHVHHDSVKEYPGCTVETLRTLAARDNWHHSSGYRSQRDMKCDVWHRTRGRVARHIVGIHQIRESRDTDD